MNFILLSITLATAGVGTFIFKKLKVPAGILIGAILFVAILSVSTGKAYFPSQGRLVVQIFAGAFIGSRMQKADLIKIKDVILTAGLLVIGMLALNLSLGFGNHWLAGLELSTALLGAAPGGIQDMALIAEDLGADPVRVTALQFARVISMFGILPSLLRFFCKRINKPGPALEAAQEMRPEAKAPGSGLEKKSRKQEAALFLRTITIAVICGLLVNMTIIPAGALVGSMFGTIIATLLFKSSYLPPLARTLTLVCSGALIGSRIGMEELLGLREILVSAIVLIVVLNIASIAFGIIMHKLTKMDIATCLFASAAGGVVEMAILADEMGADAPKVAAIHLFRFITVVALFPSIFKFLVL